MVSKKLLKNMLPVTQSYQISHQNTLISWLMVSPNSYVMYFFVLCFIVIVQSSFVLFQISGTAAKLSRNKAYHHCTLLVESDRQILKSCLDSPIKVSATLSSEALVYIWFNFQIQIKIKAEIVKA